MTLHVKIFRAGMGSRGQTIFYSYRDVPEPLWVDFACDLRKGVDTVTWRIPPTVAEGWQNLADLRMQILSHTPPAGLGSARRIYYNADNNPYPGTGILRNGEIVLADQLFDPGDYER